MGVSKVEWTKKMDEYLLKNFHVISRDEMAEELNLGKDIVNRRLKKIIPPLHRHWLAWSELEETLLMKNLSIKSLTELSHMLKRTKKGIESKLNKMEGTSDHTVIFGHLKSTDIASIMGVFRTTVVHWINRGELKSIKLNRINAIDEDYFWKWLKDNLHRVEVTKIDEYILQTSTAWYCEYVKKRQREVYSNNYLLKHGKGYSKHETSLICNYYKKGMRAIEISKQPDVHRNVNSIQCKICQLRREKVLI